MDGQNLRADRELAGIVNQHEYMQQLPMLPVDKKLIGTRLDIYFKYKLEEDGTEVRWCRGEGIDILDGSNLLKSGALMSCYETGEAVIIKWDVIKDRNKSSFLSS